MGFQTARLRLSAISTIAGIIPGHDDFGFERSALASFHRGVSCTCGSDEPRFRAGWRTADCLTVSMALLLVLAACGGGGDKKETPTSAPVTNASPIAQRDTCKASVTNDIRLADSRGRLAIASRAADSRGIHRPAPCGVPDVRCRASRRHGPAGGSRRHQHRQRPVDQRHHHPAHHRIDFRIADRHQSARRASGSRARRFMGCLGGWADLHLPPQPAGQMARWRRFHRRRCGLQLRRRPRSEHRFSLSLDRERCGCELQGDRRKHLRDDCAREAGDLPVRRSGRDHHHAQAHLAGRTALPVGRSTAAAPARILPA